MIGYVVNISALLGFLKALHIFLARYSPRLACSYCIFGIVSQRHAPFQIRLVAKLVIFLAYFSANAFADGVASVCALIDKRLQVFPRLNMRFVLECRLYRNRAMNSVVCCRQQSAVSCAHLRCVVQKADGKLGIIFILILVKSAKQELFEYAHDKYG